MQSEKKQKLNKLLNAYIATGIVLWVVAAIVILTPIAPSIYYNINEDAHASEVSSLTQNLEVDVEGLASYEQEQEAPAEPIDTRPPYDPALPIENRLIIPRIGVNAEIEEGSDWGAALQNGPWIVDNFPTPPDTTYGPAIIASHRWGGVGWSNEQRRLESFLRLPDLQNGDEIIIIWQQREYKYRVYSSMEDTRITDYNADLILYTCKLFWESPERIFRYAERIN